MAYPTARPVGAQDDEATSRPFPGTGSTTATAEATDQAPVRPTDRPFPVAATQAVSATNAPASVTTEATAEGTAALTLDNAVATSAAAQAEADKLRNENKSLQDQLASAQADKGATLYAIVIVVVGVLLALGVFFGLRRSKE